MPRTLIYYEPGNTQSRCGYQLKRLGEDAIEQLDYIPGEFSVERRIRGKRACDNCETLTQAPVPAQIIDKGISTSRLFPTTSMSLIQSAKLNDHDPMPI